MLPIFLFQGKSIIPAEKLNSNQNREQKKSSNFSQSLLNPENSHHVLDSKLDTKPQLSLMEQQLQPPPMAVTQQAYTTHSGHGSVGPVIAVVAVITILGVIAGMIGRLCSGRRIMGHGQYYDFEAWVETKCSSCLDGRLDPPPPPPAAVPGEDVLAAEAADTSPEIKEEEEQQQQQQQQHQQQQQQQQHQQHQHHQQEQHNLHATSSSEN